MNTGPFFSSLELPAPWRHAALPLAHRVLFDNGLMRLLLVGLLPPEELSLTPGWPVLVTVTQGRLEVRTGDGAVFVETSRHLRLEANVTHGLRARGVTDFLLLLPLQQPLPGTPPRQAAANLSQHTGSATPALCEMLPP